MSKTFAALLMAVLFVLLFLAPVTAAEDTFADHTDETSRPADRHQLAQAAALSLEPLDVEGRCIWLDRGTITAARNRAGIAHLFNILKDAGFNTIYFEANNAGQAMFHTKLESENPLVTESFDPLEVAVDEAHKRGMELHVWLWTFRIGNVHTSELVSDQNSPLLTRMASQWCLRTSNGSLESPDSNEYWLSPANPAARQFVIDLASEIAGKYAIDGIQLDYIRFPFQKRTQEMGFDSCTRSAFERDTSLSLRELSTHTRQRWIVWKTAQVNSFVKDLSTAIKTIRPGLPLSAAVFPFARNQRLFIIQQDWQTWVEQGWIDILNPMIYTPEVSTFSAAVSYMVNECKGKALVYPGAAILRFDDLTFVHQLASARSLGAHGITIFAAAHLDPRKLAVLTRGPYRRKAVPAHHNQAKAQAVPSNRDTPTIIN
jgi:uncharacterized lipoprotein YddW (UPF0748 family)